MGTCSTTLRPNASMPVILRGLFVRILDRREPEVGEDLRADPVLTQVGWEAELEVRLDRIEPVLLQLVRLQFVQEADAATLLRHVEKDAALLRADPCQRLVELLAAVAAKRVEDVAGQTLRVDAHEHVVRAVHVSLHERDVMLAGEELAERNGGELAVRGRQPHGRGALDELLRAPPVLDQVGDGDELEVVLLAIPHQIRHASHRPVLVHDLADDARRIQPRQPREVDGSLGLPGPLQHAARPRPQGKHVPRLHHRLRSLRGVDRHLDRARAVGRRDARRNPSRASIEIVKAVSYGVSLL